MPPSWGPGWLVDIFDVTVIFDNQTIIMDEGAGGEQGAEVFTDPWYAYDGKAYLFCGQNSEISGSVVLTTHGQRLVEHYGISVTVEEYVHYMDPYVPTKLKYMKHKISNEASVQGQAIYPFRLPLHDITTETESMRQVARSSLSEGEYPSLSYWLNTYNGNSFAIRHLLTVEVTRPWYTYNIYRYKNLCFQLMELSNNQNCIKFKSNGNSKNNSGSGESNQSQDLENNFSLHDDNNTTDVDRDGSDQSRVVREVASIGGLAGQGKCRVTLHSSHINLYRAPAGYSRGGKAGDGAIIQGTLELLDLEEAIVSAKCMLLRAEYVGNKSTYDMLECEHLVFGIEEKEPFELEKDNEDDLRIPKSRGYISRQDVYDGVVDSPRLTDPVRRGATIAFEICLDGSGRDNDMNFAPSSAPAAGLLGNTDNRDIPHDVRIQNSLWQNLSYQLNPSFYYLPLDLSKEIDDHCSDIAAAQQDSSLQQVEPDESLSVVNSTESQTYDSKVSRSNNSAISTDSTTATTNTAKQVEVHQVSSDECVSLRYFLRVVIEEFGGKKMWETIELVPYFSPPPDAFMRKNAFLSARSNQEVPAAAIIPPFIKQISVDSLAEKNENV